MPPAFSPPTYSPPFYSPKPSTSPLVPSAMVVAAMRCWRRARDNGEPVQPSLTATLRPQVGAMLAPVFASLMALCEAAMARPLRVGAETGTGMSADESMVVGLVNGSLKRRACLTCTAEAASALDCALCSTRLMVAQAMADRMPVLTN
ncbi:hypothetical protein [Novosphingobium rosa]|uniref:hypothetical protein n=1 Tax=Novosphingobium rosa TaxID=76978 RepID=UPI0008374758|nr:hypothetical protein [Novosphingobium rosa]